MRSPQHFSLHGVGGGICDGFASKPVEFLRARSAVVLFRRDPERDREEGRILYQGYEILWPDGEPVAVGLDAFCQHGVRLLGLSRRLSLANESHVELLCFPLEDRDEDMSQLPGHRVRRFLLRRRGDCGRLHFLDGTPTDVVFHLGRDEDRVLEWIGLTQLEDGQHLWVDVAARPVDSF